MVMNKQQSALMAKYGKSLDDAVRNHAADEVNYGIVRLPPGINNGVAQLVECGFGVYKTGDMTGECFFRAAGVVIEPYSVMTPTGEMRVARLQTSIMVPVCASKNATQEENVATILNEMNKLGGPGFTEGAGAGDLESLAESLKEAAPYFRFSTSQGAATPQYPTPRTWENWNGTRGLEDYVPPTDAVPGVEEGAPTTRPSTNGNGARTPARTPAAATQLARPTNRVANAATPPAKVPARTAPVASAPRAAAPAGRPMGGSRRPVAPDPTPEPEEMTAPPDTEFSDIDSLLERANTDDPAAQTALLAMAHDAGVGEDETDKATSWEHVVEMITSATGGSEGSPPEEEVTHEPAEESRPPQKGFLYVYRPTDPKTKRPARTGVECVVDSVNAKAQTVNLHDNDNPKQKYLNVPFSRLEAE